MPYPPRLASRLTFFVILVFVVPVTVAQPSNSCFITGGKEVSFENEGDGPVTIALYDANNTMILNSV